MIKLDEWVGYSSLPIVQPAVACALCSCLECWYTFANGFRAHIVCGALLGPSTALRCGDGIFRPILRTFLKQFALVLNLVDQPYCNL